MSEKITLLEKALGKRRLAKVAHILDDGFVLEVQLNNGSWDIWDHATDFTFAEIVHSAKDFIDHDGAFGAGQ